MMGNTLVVADLLPNPWTVSPNSPPNFEWYIKVVTSHQTTHHHGEEGEGTKGGRDQNGP